MQLLREIVEGVHYPINTIEQLKKSVIREINKQHYNTIDYTHRRSLTTQETPFTVVSIKKPKTQLNTIELAPLKNKTRFMPNSTLELIVKQQKNKSLQFKQKIYSQEYKEKSEYVQGRRRFNKNVESLKLNNQRFRLSVSEQSQQLNKLLETRFGSSIQAQQKSIQLKTANLPPTWEIFSTLDFNRQQTIYKTMCEQIQQQMKQITVLQEKVKQNDLLASQKIEETQNRLSEEQFKLKQEIQTLQSLLEKKENEIKFQNDQLDEQTNYIKQLEIDVQKRQESQKNDQLIFELKQQIKEQQLVISQDEKSIQELKYTIEEQEQQLDDIQNKYNQELDDKDLKLAEYQKQLELQIEDNLKLQQGYQSLNDRINSNKDYQQFEQQYNELFNEFSNIRQQYQNKCNKIKEQELTIEDLIGENSRLVIELYHYQKQQ
ncbi:unnamed protein product [Paramecium sonneborni]|uniref:Uncharacterized protein n=1 Tax=Paramecium sonneborni TaxID=65129 RepID=A0A8S1RHJ8_9CILI|nr:unnamed protein product [Paramecium sonneborni]